MNKPKLLTFQMEDADLTVTMGCNDNGICSEPFFKPTIDWKLEDPKGKPIEKVREIRDEIEKKVKIMLDETAWRARSVRAREIGKLARKHGNRYSLQQVYEIVRYMVNRTWCNDN